MAFDSWSKYHLILERGKRCELCGYNICPEILHIHHKKRMCDGGGNYKDNLIVLCPNCHYLEHRKYTKHRTIEEQIEKMLEIARNSQKKYCERNRKNGLNWAKNNPEKRKQINKRYYQRHKERLINYQKEYQNKKKQGKGD